MGNKQSGLRYWRDGKFAETDSRLPALSLAEWSEANDKRNTGVQLAAGDSLDDLQAALGEGSIGDLPCIALEFPSFADGRSYSKARLLREAHGYGGEIRAVGDVLPDQLALMLRTGFNAFEVVHPVSIARLEDPESVDMIEYYTQIIPGHEEPKPQGARFSWRRLG